jgi:hypothetical protein
MKRETSAGGYNWATLFLGGYKYGDLALQDVKSQMRQ